MAPDGQVRPQPVQLLVSLVGSRQAPAQQIPSAVALSGQPVPGEACPQLTSD
jgi:hypothetical protein